MRGWLCCYTYQERHPTPHDRPYTFLWPLVSFLFHLETMLNIPSHSDRMQEKRRGEWEQAEERSWTLAWFWWKKGVHLCHAPICKFKGLNWELDKWDSVFECLCMCEGVNVRGRMKRKGRLQWKQPSRDKTQNLVWSPYISQKYCNATQHIHSLTHTDAHINNTDTHSL